MSDSVIAAPVASAPRRPKDTLGCVSSLLAKDVETTSGGLRLHRKCMREAHVERIEMPPCDRGFLVGVSLSGGHRRTLYGRAGASERRFQHHSIYIRDFSRHFHADLYGHFDFVLVELPHAYLERVGPEHGGQSIGGLTCRPDVRDPVLGHLAHAVADSLDAGGPLNALFIEQIGLAMGTHLVRRYGNARTRELERKGMLSPAKVALAQELLMEKADLGVSIEEVANECDLSRGYFIRAFSRTTGRTPHQWLLEQRVTRARELIETSDMTLADIAVACGFADQSHLNRVFARIVGHPPGAWRRARSR
ncbi:MULTISPECIES: AraC family transcriptional regulator [unclassified Burkholderia]|uniref:helix-turn-helix domain-containing protein n=1 Tax=unclassified Burkholderia TaxID=2613784 RepID=UPI00084BEF72|nr:MULTISPECIES: AraC family transcriptional regulator [unclassified Burkholderia]RQU10640.1 AraC family transcriptional regulator [Burkholderia cenocepacia]MBR8237685.1 helix-turn-helix transcriptional regulator [Burkholderia sp. AU32357]MBY4871459.1 AraC family transcriptional regulator [Burkholderia sp. AU42008]OED12823.1 AraC family transcriptional regulator [Burkholderia sp. A2]OXI37543.1 AraC family transcriptional regulator [Burkholderia sp. AU17457]